MQNAYISSSIYCFRTKGSVYNDYSYLLNERIDRNPIRASSLLTSTPCCCACCAFPTHRDRVVPINPCYLYGLRQSALLQRSASRKLILGGRDRFVYRIQESGLGRDWYELACSVSERSGYNRRGRRGNVKCGCCVDERGESEVYDSGGLSDVEAVLSLLSEEVGDECFGRERNRVLLKRAEAERKKGSRGTRRNVGLIKRVEEESRRRSNSGSKTNVSSSTRVEGERRSFGGREKTQSSVTGRETVESSSKGVQVDFERDNRREWNSGEKSNGRYSSLESNTNHRLESARIELCKSDSREKEETRVLLRGENLRGRKEGSSSSSYYSVSSSGDFGSEADVQDKHGFMDEPGCSGYRDSEYDRGGRVDGRVSEEYRIHRDDAVDHKEISKQRNTSVEGLATWDCKKKSERKLTEVVTEETHASRKSSEMHSRILKTNESELPKTSGSQKQLDDVRENLYLTQRTKERYSQRRNHDGGETESRRRFQEGKAKLGSHRTDVETTVQSQKRLSEREESVSMATKVVQEKKVEHDKTGREDLNRDTQKLSRVSQVQVVDTGGTSNWPRQSDARRINQEEYAYVGMSSVEGSEEQYHQIGHQIDHKAFQRVRLRKGTSDVAEMSLIHASDTAKNTNSQRAFDKRITNEESITVSAATSAVEPIQRNTQTDEKLMEVKSRKEAQSSLKVSTFEEKEWGEPSRSTASSMVSQARMQRENVEVYKRRTQVPLLPPPPQLIARGSVRIESSSETTAHDVSGETSESNSALNYESCGGNSNTETQGEILYYTTEDALGSAHRQEESSSQLAGEFFEKVRQEVSTSKNQTQEQGAATVSEDKWVRGGEDGQRIASQYGSEDSQLKRNESRRSSGGSGAKGPSVEMWAVTDTSTLKSPKDEKAEDTTTGEKSEATITSEKVEATTTTGNAVAKRSGRSIWNIVADIVKLRWNPRAETDRPASKSGERVSSITSASSEAWYSGRETEENSKKNVERDKTMQPETSSDQLQPAKSFPQSEQVSGKMKSKDKAVYLEAGMLASLNKEGSGLTSTLVSLTSGEETFSPKDNQQKVRGSSGVQIVDSSQPLIASGVESPVLKESSNAGYSASVSGSLEDTDQFSHQKFDDMSDNSENSGELKQRRLQRNRQVLKNRFSQPLIASSVKSPVVEEISGAGYTASGSGSLEHMDQFGCHKLDEMTDNAQASGELKQRRLQRNKQVPKDRFDEWEEAHNVDFEQRKTDEYFMREALLEAKKAADTWEVPVGALLVQQGKIIARGYNLVEELRDSTAHAEMICIREASNVLRTWRLAESTLYVTLEPCPMCAGAIFQARVDTVVWGAPNKLLGADGSWIRLFPDGSKGNDLEPSDKPAAPVHPFHPNITIRRGVLASECADIMQQFFQLRRKKKEKRLAEPPASTSTAVSHHPSKLLTKMHDIFHMMFCL